MSNAIARKALSHHNVGGSTEFRNLGCGVSRQVYLHVPTGKAYKVPFQHGNNSHVNLHEAAVSAWFRQNYKFPGVIWPDFIVHDVDGQWVSEVTYFENDGSVPQAVARRFEKFLGEAGISDACWNVNIFSCKGFMVPIDLGYHALCGVSPWDPNYWVQYWEQQRSWEDDGEEGLEKILRSDFVHARRENQNRRWNRALPCKCSMCLNNTF
jgi:hypothetical protein